MTIFLGILLTILVFTFIVFVHEMGHFLTARFTGMKVEEFGIGIPPKAKSLGKDKKWTEYTLNWLPIWGFVRIKWEDPSLPEARAKDAFSAKRWWARVLVLVAGVTMNFILASVIFFAFFMSGATPIWPNLILEKSYGSYFLPSFDEAMQSGYLKHEGIILSPLTWSLAEKSGIMKWDIVTKVDGKIISDIETLRSKIAAGKSMTLSLSRSGATREITITPEGGKIGTYITYKNLDIDKTYHGSFSLGGSLTRAFTETYALSRMTLDVLGSTLRKLVSPRNTEERKEATEMFSWPIGIGSTFVDVVHVGVTWKILFSIIALLSINLWVLNLLPFPALDGGRIVSTSVMAFASLFTKRNALLIKLEGYVHGFGMIFLLVISLIIALMDVWKMF